ncbi:hypothetical protein ACMFMG_010040 [Clarireedia jacksonii]
MSPSSDISDTSPSPVILVTGSSRLQSLGLTLIHTCSLRHPTSIYILTYRTPSSAQPALDHLRSLGVTSQICLLQLDVDNDESILRARDIVEQDFGGLDVLVNNAGVAFPPGEDAGDEVAGISRMRERYNKTFNTNIVSVATVTAAFLPLLRKGRVGKYGKVINIGSGRGSLGRSLEVPRTMVREYSISKTALSALTLEMHKSELLLQSEGKADAKNRGREIKFWVINPGHCKTPFNGFRGTRDPAEGVEVVIRLIGTEGDEIGGGRFLETDGEGVLKDVPW